MQERVVFIRIPKNASTSMHKAFGIKNIIEYQKHKYYEEVFKSDFCQGMYDPTHIRLDMAVHYFGERILKLPIICVSRNPFDRIVSAYHFALKFNLLVFHGLDGIDFEEFARVYCANADNEKVFHANKQVNFLKYKDEILVDYVIRFENIEETYADMNRKYGLELKPLQKLNGTEHKPYMRHYSDDLEATVREAYADDFKYFNY